ncbi:hypothetical protein CLV42_1229 [Chitinophaga ginsengisoli]|uniref:Uncharacterized protein n=1 Tax=Chitinophaga ginsengisoli TaxID=363837 RepID=A0A2P8FKX9_9BACT|nr:hypothetical protein CLV42_1229 [Chitinophaga ginsengisoli]
MLFANFNKSFLVGGSGASAFETAALAPVSAAGNKLESNVYLKGPNGKTNQVA